MDNYFHNQQEIANGGGNYCTRKMEEAEEQEQEQEQEEVDNGLGEVRGMYQSRPGRRNPAM